MLRAWWAPLVLSVAIPVAAGSAAGALTATRAQADYATLRKPAWSPPARAFGVVWPALYALMGVAAWLVWAAPATTESQRRTKRVALALYAAQLLVNLAWSFVYFTLGARASALGVLLALDALVLALLATSWRIDRRAALALAPYGAWLAVATALNASVVAMNPS